MKVIYLALRESRALFNTVIGWLVIAGFLTVFGALWTAYVLAYLSYSEQFGFSDGTEPLRLADYLITPMYTTMILIFIFVCPAISMRLFSEELRQKSMELLLTSPLSSAEIVLGKFLGAMGFVTVMLALTLYAPGLLWTWVAFDPAALIGSYLGLWATAACLISMGMWFSSWTTNQIVALILSFSAAMGLYLLASVGSDPGSWMAELAFINNVSESFNGVIQLADVVYQLVFIGFFLLATHQQVEAMRWS